MNSRGKRLLEKYRSNLILQQKLKELSAKGIEPTQDELCCLYECSKRVMNPPGNEARFLSGTPIQAGNVWLWPMTIGANLCWKRISDWFDAEEPTSFYLLAYCMGHARQPEVLNPLTDRAAAKKAVNRWARKLGCTEAELDYAVDRLLPEEATQKPQEKQEDEEPDVDWQEVVGSLCRWFKGTTPDDWMWNCGQDDAMRLLEASIRIGQASAEDSSGPSPVEIESYNLRMVMNDICRRHADE